MSRRSDRPRWTGHFVCKGHLIVDASDLEGILAFLRDAERLKDTLRSGHTSGGRPESVAEHTWRLCLMAVLLRDEFPGLDFARLIRICIIHDLGEALGGDIPAVEQIQGQPKSGQERRDLIRLIDPLPGRLRDELIGLWDEYEQAATAEARLAKALDKLETIMQHNQGQNPEDFDYRFNLGYGRQFTGVHPLLAAIREVLDRETERRAQEARPGGE
ncbi:MAG: HD domain-containing protein [Isosphaeraceae bacterium]